MDHGAERRPTRALFWPFAALGVGLFLLLSGAEFLLLELAGTRAPAVVTHSYEESETWGRGRGWFRGRYEFTTPDGRQFSGWQSGFRQQPGSFRVRYLPAHPSIHHAEATGADRVLMPAFYLLPGFLGVAYGLGRLLRVGLAPRFVAGPPGGTQRPQGRALAWAAVGLAPLLGFAAFAVDRRELFRGVPADEGPPRTPAGPPGNTAGNLAQGGHVATDGTSVYFNGYTYSPVRRAGVDGSGLGVFHDGPVHFLNVASGSLYFLEWASFEGHRAFRLPLSGGRPERLMKASLTGLWVVGEWLYFTPEHGVQSLHRARLDGRGARKLHDDVALSVAFTPDWVYYRNEADGSRVYRMRHNGAERRRLGSHRAAELLPEGEWLFYRNEDDGDRLWRMGADGAGDARFLDVGARCLNGDGRWLYYCDFRDDARLYRVPPAGGVPERVTEVSVLFPHVAGDHLYVGVGDVVTELVPHRLVRDDGTGRPGSLERWPPGGDDR